MTYGQHGFLFDGRPIHTTRTAVKQLCRQCEIPEDFFSNRMNACERASVFTFTNSECGLASLNIWAGVFRWVCTNGLMVPVGDQVRSRWMHLGAGEVCLPDFCRVLDRSWDYAERLERAATHYLSGGEKASILERIAKALGQKAADRMAAAANREYRGGRTLYDAVNALTRAAQTFGPRTQSDMELYASTFLAG